jgi:tyrosinase
MSATGTVYVRRDIWSLPPDDPIVVGYAGAVKKMEQRSGQSEDDPRGWVYQAGIHGSLGPPKPGWNECEHGTWYFLPWHRVFLYYFERIVRAAVIEDGGPADWALPYWNYGSSREHATLPHAFREPRLPSGEANPLYLAERGEGVNSGEFAIPPGAGVPADALKCRGFIGKAEFGGIRTHRNHFAKHGGGTLEETPHNIVHGLIGGLMGSPDTAALDPIFWLHHANIDRIWSEWIGMQAQHHENPSEAAWLQQPWSVFDEQGDEVQLHADQVLATIGDLGYTYDTEPAPRPPAPAPAPPAVTLKPPERQMIGATDQETVLTGEPVTVAIAIDDRDAQPFEPPVRAYLNVEEITGENNPGTAYAVYVGFSEGQPVEAQSDHRVGNLAFFGIERASEPAADEAPHALESSYEITSIARELKQRGKWAGHELPVTFEPVTLVPAPGAKEAVAAPSPNHAEQPIRLGRLSVFYDA